LVADRKWSLILKSLEVGSGGGLFVTWLA
jgi:hypothetical protein